MDNACLLLVLVFVIVGIIAAISRNNPAQAMRQRWHDRVRYNAGNDPTNNPVAWGGVGAGTQWAHERDSISTNADRSDAHERTHDEAGRSFNHSATDVSRDEVRESRYERDTERADFRDDDRGSSSGGWDSSGSNASGGSGDYGSSDSGSSDSGGSDSGGSSD